MKCLFSGLTDINFKQLFILQKREMAHTPKVYFMN